jgi:hypothetical protein
LTSAHTLPTLVTMNANVRHSVGGPTRHVLHPLLASFLPWAALAALLLSACQSAPQKTPSSRAAFVIIHDRSPAVIEAATKRVFKAHGFETEKPKMTNELVFIKEGSFMNSFIHGSWYDGAVWMRVRVYQEELDPGQTLLDCDVYRVQQHDDPLFQSEQKVTGHKTAFQDLLDEVARDLDLKGRSTNAPTPLAPKPPDRE